MDYIAIIIMNDVPDTFDLAIYSYEHWSGSRVTIHDLDSSLSAWLGPRRIVHFHPLCQAIKVKGFQAHCAHLELANLQRELLNQTHGRLNRCHAGLIEAVVPVFENQTLKWIFFAGPWLAKANVKLNVEQKSTDARDITKQYQKDLPVLSQKDLEFRLEGLRQLSSRLYLWQQQQQILSSQDINLSRNQQIMHFIKARFKEPLQIKDLAKLLKISETRAAHICREECGDTFLNLLQQVRLHNACTLLQHTDCTVQHAAHESGFLDSSYFHRVFRKWINMTPAQFRKASS